MQTIAAGAHAPETAVARFNLANALNLRGLPDEAEPEIRTAVADLQRGLGPTHDRVASATVILANVLMARGQVAEAITKFRSALAIYAQAVKPGGSAERHARRSLARALVQQGFHDEAERELRHAIDQAPESNRRGIGALELDLGNLYMETDRPDEARDALERAWTQLKDGNPRQRAFTGFALARALGPQLDSRTRARELATTALEVLERDPDADPDGEAEAIRAWLAEHPAR